MMLRREKIVNNNCGYIQTWCHFHKSNKVFFHIKDGHFWHIGAEGVVKVGNFKSDMYFGY